jgi:hypothetical protein
MAVDILNSTTLSAAIDNSAFNFQVASTSNITAGQLLVVNGEAMKVNAVDDPSSGYVKDVRGVTGTAPQAHKSGARVFIGNHDKFEAVRSGADYLGLTGNAGADLPEYLLPGNRAWDAQGNEYVMVEMTETSYTGATVVFSRDGNYTAAVLTSGTHGSIGVLAEPSSSDQYAWAQVYGYVAAALEAGGTSAATSAYFPVAATSVSTPAAGLAVLDTSSAVLGFTINGMFIVGAASSATTSSTSSTGVTVPLWLNYPWTEAAVAGSS